MWRVTDIEANMINLLFIVQQCADTYAVGLDYVIVIRVFTQKLRR